MCTNLCIIIIIYQVNKDFIVGQTCLNFYMIHKNFHVNFRLLLKLWFRQLAWVKSLKLCETKVLLCHINQNVWFCDTWCFHIRAMWINVYHYWILNEHSFIICMGSRDVIIESEYKRKFLPHFQQCMTGQVKCENWNLKTKVDEIDHHVKLLLKKNFHLQRNSLLDLCLP